MEAYCLFGFIVCIVSMMIFEMRLEKRVNKLNQKVDGDYHYLNGNHWNLYNSHTTHEIRIITLEQAMNKNRSRKETK